MWTGRRGPKEHGLPREAIDSEFRIPGLNYWLLGIKAQLVERPRLCNEDYELGHEQLRADK